MSLLSCLSSIEFLVPLLAQLILGILPVSDRKLLPWFPFSAIVVGFFVSLFCKLFSKLWPRRLLLRLWRRRACPG